MKYVELSLILREFRFVQVKELDPEQTTFVVTRCHDVPERNAPNVRLVMVWRDGQKRHSHLTSVDIFIVARMDLCHKEEWMLASVYCACLWSSTSVEELKPTQNTRPEYYAPDKLCAAMIVYADIDVEEKQSLYSLIQSNGGQCKNRPDSQITHYVVTTPQAVSLSHYPSTSCVPYA